MESTFTMRIFMLKLKILKTGGSGDSLTMSNIKTLIGKLNSTTKRAMEKAAELCVTEGHHAIEVEHFLITLLDMDNTDIRVILKYYDIDINLMSNQLQQVMEKFKRGANRAPAISPHLIKLVEKSWFISSIELSETQIRSGTILQGLISTDDVRGIVLEHCPCLLKLSPARMEEDMKDLLKASPEEISEAHSSSGAEGSSRQGNKQKALEKYTIDMTAQACAGKLDPVEGRDNEIRQAIDILTRRRQNNPILVGDAGVGKTAIVEGLALRISQGLVPPSLKKVHLRSLDLGLLEAGAGVKGEFENRLKSVIEEVQGALEPVILFIDEAHTMIGSGGSQGENDAANLLKPALARGDLRTIAATTWDEYKKYFEKDAALSRRFQAIKVDEPSEETAILMLRTVADKLETYHGVTILNQALESSVHLSHRYISGRKLPDKAVSVLDTACARVHLSQNTTPLPLEESERTLILLEAEKIRLKKESAEGVNHTERLEALSSEIQIFKKTIDRLYKQWEAENNAVQHTCTLQKKFHALLDTHGPNHADVKQALTELDKNKKNLLAIQEKETLVPLSVTMEVVANVIADWTGIPAGKMLKDETQNILELEKNLSTRIIGQKDALHVITEHIWNYRAGLSEPNKPVGVFLLVGPSGVGKTETALALADTLYGGERHLITINMSEYQEAHTVSSLKGAPPGYVGYGKGGVLTEAVRRNPYSVVLLDEVEKAHPDVMEVFYQAFDKGMMEDGEGIEIDFKNTLILMTSNLGSSEIMDLYRLDKNIHTETVQNKLYPILSHHFKPAFMGRLTTVPYHPLTSEQIEEITKLQMTRIQKRFLKEHRATLSFDEKLIAYIVERAHQVESGARVIGHIISQTLLPQLSKHILETLAEERSIGNVVISINDQQQLECVFENRNAA